MHDYTRDVVAAFTRQGTPVDILQIGNETTTGCSGQRGRFTGNPAKTGRSMPNWSKPESTGPRKETQPGSPGSCFTPIPAGTKAPRPTTSTTSNSRESTSTSSGSLTIRSGTVPSQNLKQNFHALASRYGKDIIIAETAYPWTLSSGGNVQSVVTTLDALPDAAAYPPTPQGQAKFFQALNQILREVPNGPRSRVLHLGARLAPGIPADSRTGNAHSNLTLFDWWGHGLPALDAFRPAGIAGP